MAMRRIILKKIYSSPEFDVVKIDLTTVICTNLTPSAENVVPGNEEFFDDDDP